MVRYCKEYSLKSSEYSVFFVISMYKYLVDVIPEMSENNGLVNFKLKENGARSED